MSQRLIIEDDEGTTTIVPLGKDAVTIGRQQGNTIQLTEKNVSRRHARLYPEQAAWVIEDLGSYNGVKVNGGSIDGRVTLKEGDVVQIGDYHLALTEDVDKRTLNYPNAGAANDSVGSEPMLASSSTDLPRLSAEELAALQSGPHAAAQPAMLDSGPVPATPVPIGYEERKKGSAGVLIGFGAVVVIALIGGVAWMASDSKDEGTKVAKSEKADSAAPANAKEATKQANAVAPTEPAPPAKAAEIEKAVPPDPVDPPPDPPPAGDEGSEPVVVEDDPPDPPPSKAPPSNSGNKKNNKKKNQKKNQKGDASAPAPVKPPTPAVDAGALISEARKVGLKNPSKGYDLARQALKAGGGRSAAKLMATMACRIPDGGKAKKALGRLKGSDRESVAKICRAKGIDV